MPENYRRKKKLIKPLFQLRLTGIFVGLSALSLLLQFVLFTNILHETAVGLPNDGPIVLEEINRITFKVLVASFGVFLPLTLSIGVLCTFRIAGPVYRFEQFLSAVIRGERPRDFRLRKGDQLTELAALINEATRPLRTSDDTKAASEQLDGVGAALPTGEVRTESTVG
ncbi:MAG: hypothetical protein R3F49_14775 [Planctomycetota bacterium]